VWDSMGSGWQWFWLMALMCAIWLVVVVGAFFVVWGSRNRRQDEPAKVTAAARMPEFDDMSVRADTLVREEVLSGSR
jgi:heme/copper-type cytochrome/quinol oxidase subunit 2